MGVVNAAMVRRYWEVEIHVFQKFEKKKPFHEQLRRQKHKMSEGHHEHEAPEYHMINTLGVTRGKLQLVQLWR